VTIKRTAEVTLRKFSVQQLIKGGAIVIHLDDLALRLRLEPQAIAGGSLSIEDRVAAVLGKKRG
jgi:hypothetical protein